MTTLPYQDIDFKEAKFSNIVILHKYFESCQFDQSKIEVLYKSKQIYLIKRGF